MSDAKRLFTPLEAKKTLPLVRKIVIDILSEGTALRSFADSFTGDLRENPFVQEKLKLIQSFINELQEIGCDYKDWNFTFGLVDFPSVIDGEEVLLCWRSDEEDILYYHAEDDGYSGRKPIPVKYLHD